MKKLLAAFILCLLPTLALAQSNQRNPCYPSSINASNCIPVSPASPLPVTNATASYQNITTNASTVIKTSPGTIGSLIVNTAGATSSAVIYDNTSCTGTKIGTFSTLAQGTIPIGVNASTGICVTTAGGTPADITITYN